MGPRYVHLVLESHVSAEQRLDKEMLQFPPTWHVPNCRPWPYLTLGLFIQTFRVERACVRNQLSICWTVRMGEGGRRRMTAREWPMSSSLLSSYLETCATSDEL